MICCCHSFYTELWSLIFQLLSCSIFCFYFQIHVRPVYIFWERSEDNCIHLLVLIARITTLSSLISFCLIMWILKLWILWNFGNLNYSQVTYYGTNVSQAYTCTSIITILCLLVISKSVT